MRLEPKKAWRLTLWLLLATGIGLALAYRDHFDVALLEAELARAGPAAPLLFMAVYAVAAVLFLPGSVLTLAGGALFGPVLGTFYNLTGATIGAVLAFLVARHLASDWVERRAGGRLKRLKAGVEQEGWRFVAFTRLVPLFPFNLLNYALGLTRIRLSHYLLATYVCMLPGAFAYTWLGYAGREAVAGGEGLVRNLLIALALLAAVAFLPRLVSRLRRPPPMDVAALRQALDAGEVLLLDVRPSAERDGAAERVAGALALPLEELEDRLAELGDDRERPIAVISADDRRTAHAVARLGRHGFRAARAVRGGIAAWQQRDGPLDRDPAASG